MPDSLAGFGKSLPALGERAEKVLSLRAVVLMVNLLAVALVAFSVARASWQLWRPAVKPFTPPATTTPSAADYNLAALQAVQIFGAGAPPPAVSGPTGGAIPRTSLNLVLTGVILLGQNSFALIVPESGKETAFRVTDTILPGVTLESVEPDRVILVRGGSRESLMLKELVSDLPSGAFMRAAQAPASASRASPGGIAQPIGPNSVSVNWNLMKQELQKPDLLGQAHIVPNDGGGFLVREIKPGSLYEKLGLHATDVIRSVNGQAINNMDDVMRLYQTANSTTDLNVEVTRAGRPETLHYNLH